MRTFLRRDPDLRIMPPRQEPNSPSISAADALGERVLRGNPALSGMRPGCDHPELARRLENLAGLYLILGRRAEAEAL